MRLTSNNLGTVSGEWHRLVQARAKADELPRTTLARHLDVSHQYLARVIAGQTKTLPASTYLAICDWYSIEPQAHFTPNDEHQIHAREEENES